MEDQGNKQCPRGEGGGVRKVCEKEHARHGEFLG